MGANFGFKLNNSMAVSPARDSSDLIDDSTVSSEKTWSSSKIDTTKANSYNPVFIGDMSVGGKITASGAPVNDNDVVRKVELDEKMDDYIVNASINVNQDLASLNNANGEVPINSLIVRCTTYREGSGTPSASNIRKIRGTNSCIIRHANVNPVETLYYFEDIASSIELKYLYDASINFITGDVTLYTKCIDSYNGENLPGVWESDRDVYTEGTSPTIGAQVVYELETPETYNGAFNRVLFPVEGYSRISVTFTYYKISTGSTIYLDGKFESFKYTLNSFPYVYPRKNVRFIGNFGVNINETYNFLGKNAIGIGENSRAKSENSIAIGGGMIQDFSSNTAENSITIGKNATIQGAKNSVAIGNNASVVSAGENLIVIGGSMGKGYTLAENLHGGLLLGNGKGPSYIDCDYQTLMGSYADFINDPNYNTYALVFGLGTGRLDLRNGLTLDWSGNFLANLQSVAPTYDPTATYALDDYVFYKTRFYRCTTAIETAEEWDATHWTETTVMAEIKRLINNN